MQLKRFIVGTVCLLPARVCEFIVLPSQATGEQEAEEERAEAGWIWRVLPPNPTVLETLADFTQHGRTYKAAWVRLMLMMPDDLAYGDA